MAGLVGYTGLCDGTPDVSEMWLPTLSKTLLLCDFDHIPELVILLF